MSDFLEQYLNAIVEYNKNEDLAQSIQNTTDYIGEYVYKIPESKHQVGLLFGHVQSGKTSQLFGVICKAADLGIRAFVVLTSDNVILQQQTLNRVKIELNNGFCICGENDTHLFVENKFRSPTIIVLKKNARILRLWKDTFKSSGLLQSNLLFIADDEADAASLNTSGNLEQRSPINTNILEIKKLADRSLYLQVTGTPQSLWLQTVESEWKPFFTYYFPPGKNYIGGDFFFAGDKHYSPIVFLAEKAESQIRQIVLRHLAVSAQILLSGGVVSNCLFHPGVRQDVHKKVAKNVEKVLKWCSGNVDGAFAEEFRKVYDSLSPSKSEKKSFEELFEFAKNKLLSGSKILIMNTKNKSKIDEYSFGCNFIIGGNSLGRGVTFPKLHTIYYTRSSKRPQADTNWQHSRMFGYDRDPSLMQVFIEKSLFEQFKEYNRANNEFIAQIQKGITDVQVCYCKGIFPTRKNVLDKEKVKIFYGGKDYFFENPVNTSFEALNELLSNYLNEKSSVVDIGLISNILSYIDPTSESRLESFKAIINSISASNQKEKAILIVRKDRDVTQGRGSLLSPNDRSLGKEYENQLVLTVYEVIGEGWSAERLWVPNIKLPFSNKLYYAVVEQFN